MHGPRAVREQTTLIRRINQATGVAPFDLVKVADCGDAFLEAPLRHLIGAGLSEQLTKIHHLLFNAA